MSQMSLSLGIGTFSNLAGQSTFLTWARLHRAILSMGPSESPRLWPEETSAPVSSVYESCANMLPKHCRNGHGQAFQSEMENR